MLVTLLTTLAACTGPAPSRSELLDAVVHRDNERAAAASSGVEDAGGVVSIYAERVRRLSDVRCDPQRTADAGRVHCGYRATYSSATILEVAALQCRGSGWVITDSMAVTLARRGGS